MAAQIQILHALAQNAFVLFCVTSASLNATRFHHLFVNFVDPFYQLYLCDQVSPIEDRFAFEKQSYELSEVLFYIHHS